MMEPFKPDGAPVGGCVLRPLAETERAGLARILAGMEPWAGLGYGADALDRWLGRHDPALTRLAAVADDDRPAGLMALRHPWLRGPYLELLAVLPGRRKRGLGGALVAWAATRSAAVSGNLWACVSDTNAAARAFYASHGFTETGRLDDLVAAGRAELLLRKRL